MKTILRHNYMLSSLAILCFFIINSGCQKMAGDTLSAKQNDISNAQAGSLSFGNFKQVDLNANKPGYHATHISPNLHNAWGMAVSSGGGIWVSAADGGVSYIYNDKGAQLIPPVSIPSHITGAPGNPTGQVFNATTDFVIPSTGNPAKFIFASEDGTVSAWNGGSAAVVTADRAKNDASYKGIAIANDGGANFLYVTNFTKHKVDVFDANYNLVTGKPFKDSGIPSAYSPFNVRTINNMLYVTYAIVNGDGDDSTGAGLGYVDVFWPNGQLDKRLATQGTLNAPWGIAEAYPQLIGISGILIGNFGDGHINVYDWNGNFKGQLMTAAGPVAIDGLWALDNDVLKTSRHQLYFTAGPNEESDGVFGFLTKLQ
ncbi:MAG: TIGR03118 family protein [Parafilimonas sp.]